MIIEDPKAEAARRIQKLTKPPRRRRKAKRELVDLSVSDDQLSALEELKTQVHGSQGWAKLESGSVKLVKRFTPPLENHTN